jgi:hypothetical protein
MIYNASKFVKIVFHTVICTQESSNKDHTLPSHMALLLNKEEMNNMSTIHDIAHEHLTADDAILQTHHSLYNNVEGTLILSKHALLFLYEQGWRNKHYDVLLTIPYTHIKTIIVEASHRLAFTTHDASFHIVMLDIEAKFIEDIINHCIETLRLKDQAKTITVAQKKRRSRASKKQ